MSVASLIAVLILGSRSHIKKKKKKGEFKKNIYWIDHIISTNVLLSGVV